MDYKKIAIDFFESIGYTISKKAEFIKKTTPYGFDMYISENINFCGNDEFIITKYVEYYVVPKMVSFFFVNFNVRTPIKSLSFEEVVDMQNDLEEMKKNIKTIFVPNKTS